uniref:Uncharacterized protein n=1 Tax=Spongospora subterranea TaxID=70186 RepID=A0A0H5RBG1_9EUKA|eukprot:CRZ11555.1 hypothetical protein [Spongospora subterranea]
MSTVDILQENEAGLPVDDDADEAEPLKGFWYFGTLALWIAQILFTVQIWFGGLLAMFEHETESTSVFMITVLFAPILPIIVSGMAWSRRHHKQQHTLVYITVHAFCFFLFFSLSAMIATMKDQTSATITMATGTFFLSSCCIISTIFIMGRYVTLKNAAEDLEDKKTLDQLRSSHAAIIMEGEDGKTSFASTLSEI